MKRVSLAFLLTTALAISAFLGAGCAGDDLGEHMLLRRVKSDPTVSFRVLFDAGSQNDPDGKEGLAALTATLITEESTQKHSYEDLLAALYPMAASISAQVDKEMTVFSGRTHVDNLDDYYALLREVILEPGFRKDDFDRVKTDMLNYVKTSLRYSQDEELGKEALYEFIFAGTPYGHLEEGHVGSLESITLDDVREFYRSHYTWGNVVIGLGGGFTPSFARGVKSDFEGLPQGTPPAVAASSPEPIHGLEIEIVDKNAPATAISFGYPISVKRGDPDFYALALVASWLGEHRNSFSHLYQVIREARGLNYGDYAYIEHFPRGYARQFPPPNVARRSQIFQIWIRPVPHENGVFAFRAALRELNRLVRDGMSQEDFELTRKFLKGYILHYAPTTTMKLGYALDDRFYGNDRDHWAMFAEMLDRLTLDDVNAAIGRHLDGGNIKAVFVTKDGRALKDALVSDAPSPIVYASEKPESILKEDEEIISYPLNLDADHVKIVAVDALFE